MATFISGKDSLDEGTKVKFKYLGIEGEGKVTGVSMELPVVGFIYIIETEGKISNNYPYKSFVCPESYIEVIK